MGWNNIVAFQTRNPLHRAHVEMTLSAMKEINANLLIHPVVGMTKPGDVDHYTRVRCYNHVLDKYPDNSVILSLLPLACAWVAKRGSLACYHKKKLWVYTFNRRQRPCWSWK
ncbi:MAG: hypothetical protein Ct9H300mP18_14550 [Candidatus Neomarinimicrobiota bacterium]|nr:MAG: hypothetical protein Ct9H300mP18_14550 [Candidatus Neomarinimicrobiota bacterium]